MELLIKYEEAKQALYDHVGFTEDWVVYPIDSQTDMIWSTDGDSVKYAADKKSYDGDGDYYTDEVYTQRFYDKWVYEGKDLTMVFCNPGVDGMKWFRVFANKNRVEHT